MGRSWVTMRCSNSSHERAANVERGVAGEGRACCLYKAVKALSNRAHSELCYLSGVSVESVQLVCTATVNRNTRYSTRTYIRLVDAGIKFAAPLAMHGTRSRSTDHGIHTHSTLGSQLYIQSAYYIVRGTGSTYGAAAPPVRPWVQFDRHAARITGTRQPLHHNCVCVGTRPRRLSFLARPRPPGHPRLVNVHEIKLGEVDVQLLVLLPRSQNRRCVGLRQFNGLLVLAVACVRRIVDARHKRRG